MDCLISSSDCFFLNFAAILSVSGGGLNVFFGGKFVELGVGCCYDLLKVKDWIFFSCLFLTDSLFVDNWLLIIVYIHRTGFKIERSPLWHG